MTWCGVVAGMLLRSCAPLFFPKEELVGFGSSSCDAKDARVPVEILFPKTFFHFPMYDDECCSNGLRFYDEVLFKRRSVMFRRTLGRMMVLL